MNEVFEKNQPEIIDVIEDDKHDKSCSYSSCKKKLDERMSYLNQQREEFIGRINMVNGAIEELKFHLLELDKTVGT